MPVSVLYVCLWTCNEARRGFKLHIPSPCGPLCSAPFISATNPSFADSQGKVNWGNSAAVAVQQCMLGNTSEVGYCNSSHMGETDFRIHRRLDGKKKKRWQCSYGGQFWIFSESHLGIRQKLEIPTEYDFKHFLVLFFLLRSKYSCLSVEWGNLSDLLTAAMKGIQRYVAVNEITLEFIHQCLLAL